MAHGMRHALLTALPGVPASHCASPAPEEDDVGEKGTVSGLGNGPAPWPRRIGIATLLVFSAVLFMFAKNVTSGNAVTFDRVEYWVFGLVPTLFWLRFPMGSAGHGIRKIGALAWLLGLLAFLILNLSNAWEQLPFDWRIFFRENEVMLDALMCGVSAVAGLLASLVIGWERAIRGNVFQVVLAVAAVNAVLLFAMLFAV